MPPTSMSPLPTVMLSYNKADTQDKDRIFQILKEAGFDQIYDYSASDTDNTAGSVFQEYSNAVLTSDVLIVLLSSEALGSPHVRNEIETALEKRKKHNLNISDKPRTIFFVANPEKGKKFNELSTALGVMIEGFISDYEVLEIDGMNRIINSIKEDFKDRVKYWWMTDVYSLATKESEVHCIGPDDTVQSALKKIRENHFRFRHLPVTQTGKPGGNLEGVVSLGNVEDEIRSNPLATVRSVMARFESSDQIGGRFFYLTKSNTVQDALQLFTTPKAYPGTGSRYYISAIPIVESNDSNRLCGVISYFDVLKQMTSNPAVIPVPPCSVLDLFTEEAYDSEYIVATLLDTIETVRTKNYFRNQNLIPVVERLDNKVLKGIITLRELKTLPGTHLMSREKRSIDDVATCKPEDTLSDMLRNFMNKEKKAYKEYALIVANDDHSGKILQGVISYLDVFHLLLKQIR